MWFIFYNNSINIENINIQVFFANYKNIIARQNLLTKNKLVTFNFKLYYATIHYWIYKKMKSSKHK